MSATPLAHQSRSRPRPTRWRFLVRFAPPLRLVSLNAAQLAPAFDLQTSFDQARCQQLRNEEFSLSSRRRTGRAERHFVNTIKAAHKCCYRPPTRTTLAARLFDCFEKGTRKASPQQQTRASGGQAPRKSASYWRKQCPAGEFDAKSKDSALHFGRPDTLGEDKGHGSQVPPGTFYRNHTHP